MVAITQFVVAGLMTVAVQALPQQAAYSSATSSTAAPTATATSTDAFQFQGLFADLLTLPSAVRRFQRLLTMGSMNDIKLMGVDDLAKIIVFKFQKKANETIAMNVGKNATTAGAGGVAVAANIDSFPILTHLGISTTLGFMEPCGINTPHVHPRATEFLTVVKGKNIRFGYVLENGLVTPQNPPEIAGKLDLFEGTVFPQGSIHFQFNDNCDEAVFVAGLNSEDPGTNQIAQGFFTLNEQVVNATLGFPKEINSQNLAIFKKSLPANLAQDMETCLNRCNKKY